MQVLKRSYFSFLFTFFVSIYGFSKETKAKQKTEENIKSDKPNIIMILADDMGYSDLGCYGSEINTPNLNKLAQNGMRFTQMHNTSKSFPSRACLLTGVYAQQCGMSENPQEIKNSISIGDLAKSAGYRTLFSGKNHSKTTLYNFGFDHIFEFFGGATNHFNPGTQRDGEAKPVFKGKPDSWNIDDKVYFPFVTDKDFYSTDYFTRNVINYLDQTKNDKNPFLVYLAYTAPHDPLMAWPEDIAKYRGKYKVGYQAIREARYKRMLELGMVDSSMKLSEPTYRNWDALSDEEKDKEDLRMSIFAAMIDRIDQNIGKLLKKLEETGQLDNTLILFASDNGACAENYEEKQKGTGAMGTVSYWASLGEDWANVCNTPYRLFKNNSYEGGICTPFIASYPKLIKQKGTINNQALHFVDIMATIQEVTGATYPTNFRNQEIVPMQGESFLSALKGEALKERQKPIFWQWAKGKAVRVGNWKAVANKDVWALYDMQNDRNETTDLMNKNPEKFQELITIYNAWAAKNVVANISNVEESEKEGKKEKSKKKK